MNRYLFGEGGANSCARNDPERRQHIFILPPPPLRLPFLLFIWS